MTAGDWSAHGLADRRGLRWALPMGLLLVEYVTLSLYLEMPESGPAATLSAGIRLGVPVVLGAAVGAWLLTRNGILSVRRESDPSMPAWRPWPPLAAHVVSFAATAVFGYWLLVVHRSTSTAGAFACWLVCVFVTVLLAVASAVPLPWIGRVFVRRWQTQVVALALGLLAWWAIVRTAKLWGGLAGATLRSVAWVLGHVGMTVTADSTTQVLTVGGFGVEIAPVCSGIEGLGLVLLFQGVWIATNRERLRVWRALALLPLGAFAALAANVLRISILMLLGAAGREDLAAGGFHSKLGWLLFVAIALGTIAVAERVPWLRPHRRDASPIERGGVPPAAASYVAPLVAALATALVTGMWSERAFDRAYGVRIIVALGVLASVRRSLPRPSLSWSWVPAGIAAATSALWIAFARSDDRAAGLVVSSMATAELWTWVATHIVGSCVVIPLIEELAFRGFLLPWLVSPEFETVPGRAWTWPAVILSSVAFGFMHEQWLLGTVAGIAFAGARLYRGRLGDAVLAHALCNTGIAASVLLGGRWGLWT